MDKKVLDFPIVSLPNFFYFTRFGTCKFEEEKRKLGCLTSYDLTVLAYRYLSFKRKSTKSNGKQNPSLFSFYLNNNTNPKPNIRNM